MVQVAPVFVLMAIDTEILPVATVGGVVIMVVVFVMYGELMNILSGKVAATPSAYPRVDL
jgi:hypothetical protein